MDTKTESKAMQQFTETAATLNNPSLENWKEQGGKIVGYFCSSVPEELITAAGLLPFRMRAIGSEGTELSDTYFSSISCSYPRHAFDLALRGKYDFTDGVIFLNTCDHVRRLFDNWKQTVNPSFAHILSLPRKTEDPQVEWYRDELMDLKKNLENHFGVEITDDALRTAIKLHNETRHLQKQLYASRRGENPKISGTDMLVITIAGTAMPREQYNQLLRELLDDIDQSNGNDGYRARLMIVGGILDDPEYLKIIEDMGGLIVTDSLCFGSRILWKDVNETDDPLTALARYHVQERPACPRMFGERQRRADFVLDMVKEFNVDGVISERLMFCDLWGFEQYMLNKSLKDANIPHLLLEREYIMSGLGQMKTRVQAFLETIEGGR